MERKKFIKSLVIGLISAPVMLEACKKESSETSSASSESGSSNSGSATTDPSPIDVTTCSALSGIGKVICIANAFKAQLTAAQLATVQLSYSKTDAVKWSNFPQALVSTAYKRVGLNFGSMSETQISYAKALIKEVAGSSVSNEGWEEIQQILNADNYLKTINANGGYGSENYYLAFLGTPSTSGTFAIMFGGHHLALQNTYKDGILVGATPSFRGIEPQGVFTYNGTTNQPLEQEKSAFLAILASLSSSQLSVAKLSPTVSDLVAGPQKDSSIPSAYSGIKGSELTTAQRDLIFAAIKTYCRDVSDYTTFLNTYESELGSTYVAYSGNTDLGSRGDYIRIHGPSVWIEWAVQAPVALSQPHVHSVWRDRLNDYGGN